MTNHDAVQGGGEADGMTGEGSSWPVRDGVLGLGDLPAERGGVISDARLVWQADGTLNAARDNVIVYPCSYTAAHNVRAQHRLLTEHLGITKVAAAYGFSMGAGQAYHWAALFPDFVERAIVVCGSTRTSLHNKVFLSGLLRTLEAAPQYLGNGRFSAEPVAAVRAFAHIYAGWGLSQDFYRERLFETALGAPDLAIFLTTDWEESFGEHRAANLYAQALTWQEADISANDRCSGDLARALSAITARVLLMPSATDLYFRVADNEAELAHLRSGALATIPSIWGHRAGSPEGIPADLAFLTSQVRSWLDR